MRSRSAAAAATAAPTPAPRASQPDPPPPRAAPTPAAGTDEGAVPPPLPAEVSGDDAAGSGVASEVTSLAVGVPSCAAPDRLPQRIMAPATSHGATARLNSRSALRVR